jgi:hypothetical protein
MTRTTAIKDIGEIRKNDLAIHDERPTPTRIERIDFENKQYIASY